MAANAGAWESPEAPVAFIKLPRTPDRTDGGLGGASSTTSLYGPEHVAIVAKIRAHLATGKCVVVYPHFTSPSDAFDRHGVRRVCGSLDQQVDWQG